MTRHAPTVIPRGLVKTDERGTRSLSPYSGFDWMDAFMRFGLERREVPAEHWDLDRREPEGDVAVVSCVCGQQTEALLAAYPTRCECGRWFFYDGTDVWSLAVGIVGVI